MRKKGMIDCMAGLLFVLIFCLSSWAFGCPFSNNAFGHKKRPGQTRLPSEVVFIDPSVTDVAAIETELPINAVALRLSPGMDGIAQISAHLANKRGLSTIRIISHGSPGYFVLNGERIDRDFLRDHGGRIVPWGRALVEKGDILFYACNLAASYEGKVFVDKFANLTGADIAASTDVTGGEAFDGNWDLEYTTGRIEAAFLALDPGVDIQLAVCDWLGGSTNWQTVGNWNCGREPLASDSVTIGPMANEPVFDPSTPRTFVSLLVSGVLHMQTADILQATTVTNDGTITAGVGQNISVETSDDLNLNGDITSADGNITLDSGAGNIVLMGNSNIISTSGSITFNSKINGANILDVDAGTGSIRFKEAIGDSAALTRLIITDSSGTNFDSSVTTDEIVSLIDTTGNIRFHGALVTRELELNIMPYDLDLYGSGTIITDAVTFSNTGILSLGWSPGDTLLFNGGLTATSPSEVIFNGQVRTSGDTISVGDADTAIILASATILDTTNNGGTAAGGTITVGGAVDGTVANAERLAVNGGTAGTATFSKNIGETTPLSTLTLTNGNLAIGGNNITGSGITVNGGTFGLASSPSGDWDVGDVDTAGGATMNATTGSFNVSGNWTNNGTFNHKDGTVTLVGTGKIISGATSFFNLTKNVTTADTLTFTSGSANKTTITNILNLTGASGQLLSLRSSSPGTQWEIDPQGNRNISYLDVKDSKNVNETAINAIGTNCVDSDNNTNWSFLFVAPTVTTQEVNGIGTTSATGNGNITDLGAPNPTQHGVCWNTTGTPTTANSKTEDGAVSATGAFTSSITGLSAGIKYYVRAYATNSVGTAYGGEVSFTANVQAPTVTTQEVNGIGTTSATGNGNITDLGAPNPTQHGVCWNTTGTPTTANSKTEDGAVSATGAFTSYITPLSPNTTYYVRTYATNTAGTAYGGETSFTTYGTAPTLATTTPTSYDCSVKKVEMYNGSTWVAIFSGTASLDIVPGGTFPGVSDLSLPAGTYSQIRVTLTNSFPLEGSRSYGGTTYYTTAATFGSQTNLASTPTTVAGSVAEFSFRIESWGAINADFTQTFSMNPFTVGPSTDYQPILRFTLNNKLLLKGTDGTPSTYYFALTAPTVSIVEP
jgi:hypothetical protein